MANLWDTLEDEQKTALVKAHIAGSAKTPENMSRASAQLSQNPNLVERLAKEAGITEGEEVLSDETDVEAENEIEANVDTALQDEGDMQTPGDISKTQVAEAGKPTKPVNWQKLIDNASSDADLLKIIKRMKQNGISPPADLEPIG